MAACPATPNLVSLRPVTMDDAPRIAELANDWGIGRFTSDRFPFPYALADAERFIGHVTSPGHPNFGVVDGTGQLVGMAGVFPGEADGSHHGTLRIGYWLGRAAWGRGLASAALALLLPLVWADPTLAHVRRIEAQVAGCNGASAAVLMKHGFTLEGRARQAVQKRLPEAVAATGDDGIIAPGCCFRDGPFVIHDLMTFSLLRCEWDKRHGAGAAASTAV